MRLLKEDWILIDGSSILILSLTTVFMPVKFYFSYLQSNISIENGHQSWWRRPDIQATLELEPRESHVQGQLGQFSETLSQDKNAFKEAEEG